MPRFSFSSVKRIRLKGSAPLVHEIPRRRQVGIFSSNPGNPGTASIKLREMIHKIEHFPNISTRIQVRSHPTGCTRAFTNAKRTTAGGWRCTGLSRVERVVKEREKRQGSALGGDDAHRACIRSRRTILTQMRNSLSRRTINNRDKGFMVARETAAIKVSDCFQSVNSRCHEVGARQRAGAASRRPFPSDAGLAVFAYHRYRRRWTVSAYMYVTFTRAVR